MKLNPLAWSFRALCILGAIASAGLLAYALYVQHVLFIDPCPLCIFQRVAFAAFGLVCTVGALHGPATARGRVSYGLAAAAAAGAGAAVAARHVWLQNLPADEVPSCGPGLNYMLDSFPVFEVFTKVLQGSGECAEVDWAFAGLSMPTWTLVCFLVMLAAALWAGFMRR